ncbi:unnamed protein product [Rotaria sp. Silwood1]|nr:unnamed protein product [Rotaria sp. Silwood1]CAF3432147.1 unnamed protein product [Rotaria sp. Silwood1]CAF4581744.1 unnamed protein product [Rotaria sp. Silwood1]CAF4864119.1 unnamed protein product [Rotaria sp. Silwood1]
MNYFILLLLFIFPILSNAQTVESNSSLINAPWFWPLLTLCLALLLSVPCTLIIIIIFCHKKKQLNDSDESSIGSNSSSSSSSPSPSSTPVQQRSRRDRSRFQPSHYIGSFPSPPPPYSTNEHPQDVSVTSSLPPPYESFVTENESIPTATNPTATIINVEPIESIGNQSANLNVSSISSNSSIQTCEV